MALFFLNLILLILVFPHYADSQTSHIDQYRIVGAEMGQRMDSCEAYAVMYVDFIALFL